MKANISISDYALYRNNSAKLTKLENELTKLFSKHKIREGQSIPEEGINVEIHMSAKYQSLYVHVDNWGSYMAVGEFEDLVKEALENRGYEVTEEDGDEYSFKIGFE